MPKAPVLTPDVWAEWPDEKLLELRMCQLGVTIDDSVLATRIAELQKELDERGLAAFKPHFWLSDEWFSPDAVPGVAIPFYLAHPRLERLERAYMLDVEGGTPEWCMRILRHEAGHAIDNAYKLRRRRRRQQIFGPSYKAYPQFYDPKPYSKSFVLHLDSWYAQSHPDEDFAETFAVWLNPQSDWRARYVDWPALKKLEYIGTLMHDIAGKPMLVHTHRRVDPLPSIRKTLRAHYERKRRHYGLLHPDFYDRDLRRLFSDDPAHAANMKAARFIARVRRDVRRMVASWTGEYQYTIDQVLEAMLKRTNELNLRLTGPEDRAKQDFLVMLTVQTMNYLHSGRHRVAL
jgi:putative zinc-binding metallo-peptidase